MKVNIKRTNVKPYGFRLQIEVDGTKIDNWYLPYKSSKSTAYRKGFSLTGETEIFTNIDSLTSETDCKKVNITE